MKRGGSGDSELPGQDSFLDIVANMVGILIILVMVVGVRASYVPIDAPQAASNPSPAAPDDPPSPQADDGEQEDASLYLEVMELTEQLMATEHEVALRDQERVTITAHSTRFAEALEIERTKLDEYEREELRARTEFAGAERRLAELSMERIALESVPDNVEIIKSLPTPIATTVHGEELHVRLSHGLIAVLPMDPLLDQVRNDAETRLWRLKDQATITGTVGPVHGFRLRYQFAKHVMRTRGPSGEPATGSVARLVRFELLPVEEQIGEPLEQALMPGSAFSQALRDTPPGRTTVTVWTYPDSFPEFRALKKELFERGYATAGRPLLSGVRIGASIHGSRSAAQ